MKGILLLWKWYEIMERLVNLYLTVDGVEPNQVSVGFNLIVETVRLADRKLPTSATCKKCGDRDRILKKILSRVASLTYNLRNAMGLKCRMTFLANLIS